MHSEQDYIGKQFLNTFFQILLPTLEQAFLYIALSVFSITLLTLTKPYFRYVSQVKSSFFVRVP